MSSCRAQTTLPEIVPKEAWEREFSLTHAIPSSKRTEPAKALVMFREILGLGPSVKVLDAGAGNGRNSVYLAKQGCHVTAVDSSESALGETRRRVEEAKLADDVLIVRHSLGTTPVPFSANSFDFVLDAYVFCHFLADEVRHGFWYDMGRITKPGGHLLSIVFSPEDEYYAQFLADSPDGMLVCDPANGIWKRLYSEGQIKSFFADQFEMKYFAKVEFSDLVLDRVYRRVLLTSVLKKPTQ